MKKLFFALLVLVGLMMFSATPVISQQTDLYYAGAWKDTLAVVYKNNELLYSNFEEGHRWCWANCIVISNNGDVYYGGAGDSYGYVWKNGEVYFEGNYRSSVKDICYNAEEDVIYSVGTIFYEENGNNQQRCAVWRGNVLYDTIGESIVFPNDIDFMDGHCYILGTNHSMSNGIGELTIWKDMEPLYVLGNASEIRGLRTLICHEGHVYACGILKEGGNDVGKIWKDGEVLFNYGSYAYVLDFCIDGEDIYACGEINVENQEQKAVVWKNNEVLYEYDYACFIEFYTILKVEEDLYFGGASYYYGKQSDEMRNSSYGVLFKNGEAIEIDPQCTTIFALAVSSETNALQESEHALFVVFPNPAHNRTRIEGIEPNEVRVYNALGQLVKTERNSNEINVSDLQEGVYLLQITDKNGATYSKRLVLNGEGI